MAISTNAIGPTAVRSCWEQLGYNAMNFLRPMASQSDAGAR